MELRELLERRRMVRSFDGSAIDPAVITRLCADALWAPTAGNTAGVRMHVVANEDVAGFFEAATDEQWRASARRAPGLQRAGTVVLVSSRPADYAARYAEPDKCASGLGELEAWTIPFWHTDAAMSTMTLLLLIEEAGLSATIWGNFGRGPRIMEWAGAHDEELFASVLVGRDDGADVTSPSLARVVPERARRVSRVDLGA